MLMLAHKLCGLFWKYGLREAWAPAECAAMWMTAQASPLSSAHS